MTNEPQSKEIDGFVFTISLMPGWTAQAVFTRLLKALGRGAAGLADAMSGGEASPKLLAILSGLDEADLEFIAKKMLASAMVRQPNSATTGPLLPVYDAVFAGRIDMAFKLLFFAATLNFGSFSKGLSKGPAQAGVGASAKAE